MASVVFFGLHELETRMARLAAELPLMLARGLYEEGQEVLAKALRITPIDTGNLRSTGHVSTPVIAGPEISVDVGFGGSSASYVIFVHERLDATHAPPTQAKFLEKPALEHAPAFLGHMVERLAKLVELS